MDFNCADANEHRKRKWKREEKEKGIFVDFKQLESPSDDDFFIGREKSTIYSPAKTMKQLNVCFLQASIKLKAF